MCKTLYRESIYLFKAFHKGFLSLFPSHDMVQHTYSQLFVTL